MNPLLLIVCLLGMVKAQSTVLPKSAYVTHASAAPPADAVGLPQECLSIITNKTQRNVTYSPRSVANVFNMYCGIINEFTDCLDRNRNTLHNSTSPIFRILADNFDKELVRSRMKNVCNLLPGVANDLECLKSATNNTNVKSCLSQYRSHVTSPSLTLDNLCRAMTSQARCLRQYTTPDICPSSVVEFYLTNELVFIPTYCQSSQNPTMSSGTDTSYIDSVIFICAWESFHSTLNGVVAELGNPSKNLATIARIFTESLNNRSICSNRTAFATCVQDRYVKPFSEIDSIVARYLNPNLIGSALNQFCELRLSRSEETCLKERDTVTGLVFCVGTMSLHLRDLKNRNKDSTQYYSNPNYTTPTPVEPGSVSDICSAIRTVDKCVRIQLQRCSSSLAQTFTNVERQLLSTDCFNAKSKWIENSHFTSVMMYCGMHIGGELYLRIIGKNTTIGGKQANLNVVKDFIPYLCGNMNDFVTCIAREVGQSKNILDRISLKLLDLTNAYRLQVIFGTMCDRTRDIQDNVECFSKGAFTNCTYLPKEQNRLFMKYLKTFQNNITYFDVDSVTELCGTVKEFGMCGARALSPCSKDLSQLGQNIINELLRPDCGGSRPLTRYITNGTQKIPLKFTLFSSIFLLMHFML
ncbi:uncharacterized protein [Mytilus edulis]|uniref:uncharacterized protein isoform X2 n=1 Tax=Mytilus edulis TaxID=6550 RepID=UPI0039EF1979